MTAICISFSIVFAYQTSCLYRTPYVVLYLFRDHVAQVQSWSLAAVSGRLVSQLNDLATSPPGGVKMYVLHHCYTLLASSSNFL